MAILVDPPRWPAHGTQFGHMDSEASLDELHDFARAAGLHSRAFDHDHYDVPVARYPDLIGQGAIEVPSSELLKRLVAAGLRVRSKDRTPKRAVARSTVLADWNNMLPDRPELRDELIRRWSEEARRYHDVRHLAQCLSALDLLGVVHASDRAVRLASNTLAGALAGRLVQLGIVRSSGSPGRGRGTLAHRARGRSG